MINRRSKLIRVGLIAAAIGSIAFVAHILSPREPTYEGQPFSYWVDRLPVAMVLPFPTRNGLPATRIHISLIDALKFGTNTTAATVNEPSQKGNLTAHEAVDAVGTNCLQMLVTKLGRRETPLKRTLTAWAVKLRLLKSPDLPIEVRRGQALYAIVVLGKRAEPIVPQLKSLSTHSDTNISSAAEWALERILGNKEGSKGSPRTGQTGFGF